MHHKNPWISLLNFMHCFIIVNRVQISWRSLLYVLLSHPERVVSDSYGQLMIPKIGMSRQKYYNKILDFTVKVLVYGSLEKLSLLKFMH